MGKKSESSAEQSQLDKFKEAAHELECDDDEKRFAENLGKLVAKKPHVKDRDQH